MNRNQNSTIFLKSKRLSAVFFMAALCVGRAGAQTAIVNGASQAGTLPAKTTNSYTFTANVGSILVLRLGTTGFDGALYLYGPNGAFLKTAASGTDAELAYAATNSGTFTAEVSSYSAGGSGTYVLHLAQFPGAFIVPAGEAGGPMTNGGSYAGTLSLGDLNLWSFTANAADNLVLRLGTTGFDGNLRLYGPNGALLKTAASGTDAELDFTATNSGTFTALVSSYTSSGTGTYALHLAQFPEPFIVPAGEAGGPMTNGGSYTRTLAPGDLNLWSVTANAGDNLVLRLGTTGFDGNLRLYGPNGALLKTAASGTDAELDFTATNSGTFTALVSSYTSGGTGTYALHLAQFPEPFIVPAGEAGGPMTNGGSYTRTLALGDLNLWSVTANAGDNLVLRLGTTGFDGNLRLYGPNGALLKTAASGADAELDFTATNSGTFTALVSSYASGGTGTYDLHLAQFPEAFMVPAGGGGGPMTGAYNYPGTIALAGENIWAFTACTGDAIQLVLSTTGFDGNLSLYGPNGALLKTAASGTLATIDYTATNCGTFAALVTSYSSGGTGTYSLSANGLSDGLKLCPPVIQAATLTLIGVGGGSGATFILYSATNAASAFAHWTSIETNQFDRFGVFGYTNGFNRAQQQQYWRLLVP